MSKHTIAATLQLNDADDVVEHPLRIEFDTETAEVVVADAEDDVKDELTPATFEGRFPVIYLPIPSGHWLENKDAAVVLDCRDALQNAGWEIL